MLFKLSHFMLSIHHYPTSFCGHFVIRGFEFYFPKIDLEAIYSMSFLLETTLKF